MEDVIQFLVVFIIIAVGFFIQVNKVIKKGEFGLPPEAVPVGEDEIEPDDVFMDEDVMPEVQEVFSTSKPVSHYVSIEENPSLSQKQRSQKHQPRGNDSSNRNKIKRSSTDKKTAPDKIDAVLKSHEGAKQAFIYSEIFNKKYE